MNVHKSLVAMLALLELGLVKRIELVSVPVDSGNRIAFKARITCLELGDESAGIRGGWITIESGCHPTRFEAVDDLLGQLSDVTANWPKKVVSPIIEDCKVEGKK